MRNLNKISFNGHNNRKDNNSPKKICKDDSFISNFVLNVNKNRQYESKNKGKNYEAIRNDLLIISCPKYSEAVNKLADWKKTLGFHVEFT